MKSKILLLLAILLLPSAFASACVDESPGPYASNPFRIIRMPEQTYEFGLSDDVNRETLDFWRNFTAGQVTDDQIRDFFNKTEPATFNAATDMSPLTVYLRNNKQKAALDYISDCFALNAIQAKTRSLYWEYEKPSAEVFLPLYNKIKNKNPKGELGLRYKLLKLRVLTEMRNDNAIMEMFKKDGDRIPDTAIGRRIRGYYGGFLYRKGNYIDALDYFDLAHDPNSVAWCVEKLIGLDNLKKLYAHAPESKALEFVLQDYVNYLIMASCAPEEYRDFMLESSDDATKEWIYNPVADIKEFMQFAEEVVEAGHIPDPMAWKMAVGIARTLMGETEEGVKTMAEAATLKGSEMARATLPKITCWALLKNWDGSSNSTGKALALSMMQLADDFRRGQNLEVELFAKGEYNFKSYDVDFFTGFFAAEATKEFKSKNPGRCVAFLQWADDLSSNFNRYGFLSANRDMMDREFSKTQLNDAITFLENQAATDVDVMMLSARPYARSMAYDVAGTRLLREGKFKEAKGCFDKMIDRYIVTSAIYPYLSRGFWGALYGDSYTFRRSDFNESWSPYYAANIKSDFCHTISNMMEEYDEGLPGDTKAEKAMLIAGMMHIASPGGDCWAISEFSWSIGSQYNSMTEQCSLWLQRAMEQAQDPVIKAKAMYAMLSLPINQDQRPTEYTFDDRWEYHLTTPALRNAMTTLKRLYRQPNMPDYISSCDAIASYRGS